MSYPLYFLERPYLGRTQLRITALYSRIEFNLVVDWPLKIMDILEISHAMANFHSVSVAKRA